VNWVKGAIIAVVSAAVGALAVSQITREPVEGQASKPNLNGIWQAVG